MAPNVRIYLITMHICHMTSVHQSNDTRIVLKQCRSVVQAGHSVSLVVKFPSDCIIDHINILSVPKPNNRVHRMIFTVYHVYKRALASNADIYHFHDPELLIAGLILKYHGKHVIYDMHEDAPRALLSSGRNYVPTALKKPMSVGLDLLESLVAKRLSAVVAATEGIGRRARTLNSRAIVVNNYPMLDELVAPQPVPWSQRSRTVAYVGGIAEVRGVVEMVAAAGLVQQSGVRLQLAGAFSPASARARVVAMPAWAAVDELGVIGRRDMAALLATTQAGLVVYHPGPNHTEAQPNKLYEYMSAAIPVIASDVPLWRELIERHQCGLVVDPLNPQAIADAITWLLEHPAEAEAMGQRGRRAVETEYNWAIEARKLLDLYDSLAAGRQT